MIVYGPYTDKNSGRKKIVFYDPLTQKRTSTSYARYLMEEHLGRKLDPEEYVDHINEDKTDDRIENLQVLTNSENVKKHHKSQGNGGVYEFICPECGKEAQISRRQYNNNQLTLGKRGPYCSNSCSAKARNKRLYKTKENKQ